MNDRLLDNWTTQLRKGLLDLCVLSALADTRMYGYDIVRRLRSIEGLVISEGTIYPILGRFSRDGLVRTVLEESKAGPARKYYQLAATGREVLERMNAAWVQIVKGVGSLQSETDTENNEP